MLDESHTIEWKNPFDEEYQLQRRDLSEAGQLRRAAFEHERCGRPVAALLLRNVAWLLEHEREVTQ
jgi:hypothetical protein